MTSNSQPGNINVGFDINLVTKLPLAPKGANNRYLDINGSWKSTRNFSYNIGAGDNSNNWHSVEVTSEQIPFDGLLYIKLAQASSTSQETHYKDLRIEYLPTVNESSKIKGHTHIDTQGPEIRNNEDIEIFIDTSPRNSIAGTLFLNTLNGLVQKLTSRWKRAHIPLEKRTLGNLMTFETLFWHRVPRSILEGSFIGLLHNNGHRHVSLLSVMKYTYYPELNFVFGKLEIDYKHDKINNSPMWEIWKDGEIDGDLANIYEFKYLYTPK